MAGYAKGFHTLLHHGYMSAQTVCIAVNSASSQWHEAVLWMWILTQETARIVELAHWSKEFKNSYIHVDSSVVSVCTDIDSCCPEFQELRLTTDK